MDRNAIRERLLTGFKPKEKNIDTPYLGDLDGQLKLVGLTGKQSLDLDEQATDQTFDAQGNAINKVNPRKLAALAIAACLRMRSTGEAVLSRVDVLGEKGDGNGALLEMDNEVFKPLIGEIMVFLGRKPTEDTKKNLPTTNSDSSTSSLPPDSDEPSMNS